MNNFNYYAPTRIVFGLDTEKEVGKLLKQYGATNVLIHYGSERIVKSGLLDTVTTTLDEEGIAYITLGGVVANPHLGKVYEGIELGRNAKIDFILAIGGGSVIDSAKAIGYGIPNTFDVWDIFDKKAKPTACIPIGVIVTMAAAGSEMSNSAVITNEQTGEKRGSKSDLCRPRFAIMNPALTVSLPDYQTQAGCTDIMMHTMERYFTNKGNLMLTDEIAEGLLRTVKKNALILHENPQDLQARTEVMWASSLSHNGLTECGNGGNDFACHSLEHELSTPQYNVAHGAGLAAVWGSWARYVMEDCLHRFVKFALNVMEVNVEENDSDMDIARKGIEAMENHFRSVGMPTSLHELGLDLSEEECKNLAASAAKGCGGSRGAAKVLYEDDFYNIYLLARGIEK